MSQQNNTPDNYREDEIDLRKVFQAIGKGFVNIGKAFVNFVIRIKRVSVAYKLFLIISIALGISAGITYNKMSKPYFNTSMLLSSEYFNARLVENNIDKLNTLCGEEEKLGLANVLGINADIAKNIKGFDFEPLVSEQDIVDVEVLKQKLEELKVKDPDISKVINQIQIQNKKTYILTVQVFDNTIVGNLEESLVKFFRNSPFVRNRININKSSQLALISKLEHDLKQLDSLKRLFNLNLRANAGRKSESTSSSVYVGESGMLDPTSFYDQSVSLYRQLQYAQKRAELGDDFELIDGFTVFSKPESPGLVKTTLSSLLTFMGISYLLIILIETNRYLNRVEKERF